MPDYTAYHKQNCTWPAERAARGWRLARLLDRLESGIRQYLRTPKGSLLVDPLFGTELYRLRTQGMSLGANEALKADLHMGFKSYFPDVRIAGLEVAIDGENELLQITLRWGLAGAELEAHGELAQQRTTSESVSF